MCDTSDCKCHMTPSTVIFLVSLPANAVSFGSAAIGCERPCYPRSLTPASRITLLTWTLSMVKTMPLLSSSGTIRLKNAGEPIAGSGFSLVAVVIIFTGLNRIFCFGGVMNESFLFFLLYRLNQKSPLALMRLLHLRCRKQLSHQLQTAFASGFLKVIVYHYQTFSFS